MGFYVLRSLELPNSANQHAVTTVAIFCMYWTWFSIDYSVRNCILQWNSFIKCMK